MVFIRRHLQREERKLDTLHDGGAWWQELLQTMADDGETTLAKALENLNLEKLEEGLSDLDEGCTCQGNLNMSCDFHGALLKSMEQEDHLRDEYVGFWKKHEQAKLTFGPRIKSREQYQVNLVKERERREAEDGIYPPSVPWFRRITRILKERQREFLERLSPDNAYRSTVVDHRRSKYAPPNDHKELDPDIAWPDPEDFDDDISELSPFDLETGPDDLWERLCACPDEVYDCECGAWEDCQNGDLNEFFSDYGSDGGSSISTAVSITDQRFKEWKEMRVQRKHEIKAAQERRIQARNERLAQQPSLVARHESAEQEIAEQYSALQGLRARKERGPEIDGARLRRYNLYCSELASLPWIGQSLLEQSTLSFTSSVEGSGDQQEGLLTLSLGHAVCRSADFLLPTRGRRRPWFSVKVSQQHARPAQRGSARHHSHRGSQRSSAQARNDPIDISVLFLSNDHVEVKVPASALLEHIDDGLPPEDGSPQCLSSEYYTFSGVNFQVATEKERAKQTAIAREERERRLRGPSPRESWFERTHPAGHYGMYNNWG